MKKLVQIFALLSLLVVFLIISANARTVQRYEANIPFDFSVNEKTYSINTINCLVYMLSDLCWLKNIEFV